MSMGPPQAEDALQEALALGADRAILLSDRVFAVADTLGTSRTLAFALRKEGFDLIVCGRKSTDSETWQVPSEVAAFLGIPHLTNATAIEPGLRVTRETDEAEEVWQLPIPALVSVATPPEEPRPGGHGDSVETWGALDLVDEVYEYDHRFGQTGSPTRVLAVRDVTPERAQFRAASVEAARAKIDELLAERAPEPPSWEKPPHAAEQPAAFYDCWVLVETRDGRATRTSLELLARAHFLSGKLGGLGRGARARRRRTGARGPRGRDRAPCPPRRRRVAGRRRGPPTPPPARPADPRNGLGTRGRAARGRRARARDDRRLRRRRHREGRAACSSRSRPTAGTSCR